ncbi:MAG: hypothetical protein KKE69_05030 [Alphaproteobacteria bacterium]|nr:hypothetical protein [Alphaproteobacteria bacterium]
MPRKTAAPKTSFTVTGSRLSLPGQNTDREAWLRDELSQELTPQGLIEKRWVEDIAYRWVRIDLIRAQAAGLQNKLVTGVLEKLDDAKDVPARSLYPNALTRKEREVLEACNAMGKRFETDDMLDNPDFAWLMGQIPSEDMQPLKALQGLEHDEARERDRVINQFERRRRLQVQHLIMLIDTKKRGALPVTFDSPDLEVVICEGDKGDSDATCDAEG